MSRLMLEGWEAGKLMARELKGEGSKLIGFPAF
jgi:hypothetical protein